MDSTIEIHHSYAYLADHHLCWFQAHILAGHIAIVVCDSPDVEYMQPIPPEFLWVVKQQTLMHQIHW
jgi:hypothetical protein